MLRLYTNDACLMHQPGPSHPESPARLRTVLQALDHHRFTQVERVDASPAEDEQLLRVHGAAQLARIRAAASESESRGTIVNLDADTVIGRGSLDAALCAAGAVVAAVDAVLRGECRRAFCAVRPPGHHATPSEPMGFCLLNNIAIGAAHALAKHHVERVAILDFDVHHGNGTQDYVASEPRAIYLSSHQSPLYPGTGALDAPPNVFNAPLPPGSVGRALRDAWTLHLLPNLETFRPRILLVSAGFDAHRLDPLADLNLDDTDYAWLGTEITAAADRLCEGRMVSVLEGGYSLSALARAVPAYLTPQLLD